MMVTGFWYNSPTLPNTSNITLNPGKCMFKIFEIIGVSVPEGRRGSLPPMLTAFQSYFLMFGDLADVGRNKFFL